MIEHQKPIHHKIRDYPCDKCKKKFGKKWNLLQHQKTVHEGCKDYACDKCEQKFGEKSSMLVHQRIVHEGRTDYACGECEQIFGVKSHLLRHQKTNHEGRKDFACSECGKKFGLKRYLLSHQKRIHESCKNDANEKYENKSVTLSNSSIPEETVDKNISDLYLPDMRNERYSQAPNFTHLSKNIFQDCENYANDNIEQNFEVQSTLIGDQKIFSEYREKYACDKCERKFGLKLNFLTHQKLAHDRSKDDENGSVTSLNSSIPEEVVDKISSDNLSDMSNELYTEWPDFLILPKNIFADEEL